ncbi:MAG: hypothetical protein QXW39_06770 [Candidatus Bathyarchaeia archaeon]
MLIIKDLESKISHLEGLLESISKNILANVVYEEAPASKLLADSEGYISELRKIGEEVRNIMLVLKPERAPSIEKAFNGFVKLIDGYVESLKMSERTQTPQKTSLEYLRKIIVQCQSLIDLAKDVAKNPSKSISEVLRLKEISNAKDYISRIHIPEAVDMRLEYFRRSLENFKALVLSLEQSARELLKYMERLEEEISRFQQR